MIFLKESLESSQVRIVSSTEEIPAVPHNATYVSTVLCLTMNLLRRLDPALFSPEMLIVEYIVRPT